MSFPAAILDYVNLLCDRYDPGPLDEEEINALVAEVRLDLQTSGSELSRHLACLRFIVSYRHSLPLNRKEYAEESRSFSALQKLVRSLSDRLSALADPENPESRALSRAAFFAAMATAPTPISLAQLVDAVRLRTCRTSRTGAPRGHRGPARRYRENAPIY